MSMHLKPIFIREIIIKAIREFFYRQNFHEIITPVLNKTIPLEPNIYSFETYWHTKKGSSKYFLSTSPEASLKKMIAKGAGNCFAIGKSFRNLENSGPQHSPEFLMLEWYRENADYKKIIKDAQKLIKQIKKNVDRNLGREPSNNLIYKGININLSGKWLIFSLVDLFNQYAKCNLAEIIDDKKMIKLSEKKGYSTKNASWEQLFNQIFLNEIEPKLGIKPCFIIDFPSRISPLCAKRADQPYLSERFEIYLAGIELGNGNTENTDAGGVKQTFVEEANYRKRKKLPTPPLDEEFLTSLNAMKKKKCAGIGLGLDRLAMIFGDFKDITALYSDF